MKPNSDTNEKMKPNSDGFEALGRPVQQNYSLTWSDPEKNAGRPDVY